MLFNALKVYILYPLLYIELIYNTSKD